MSSSAGVADSPPTPTGLRVVVQTGTLYPKPGDEVTIILDLINTGSEPLTLQFPTAQRFDFEVIEIQRSIWKWSDGRMFAQVVSTLTLAPGESRRFTARWSQRDRDGGLVAPGTYLIRATVPVYPAPLGAQTHLEIR